MLRIQEVILSKLGGKAIRARTRSYIRHFLLFVIFAGTFTKLYLNYLSNLLVPVPLLLDKTYFPESLRSFTGK